MALHLKATGLDFADFGSDTGMTSELLKDYEEGTFDAVMTGGSGGSNTDTDDGRFTKIGRFIYCMFNHSIYQRGGLSGSLSSTLPVTAVSSIEQYHPIIVYQVDAPVGSGAMSSYVYFHATATTQDLNWAQDNSAAATINSTELTANVTAYLRWQMSYIV